MGALNKRGKKNIEDYYDRLEGSKVKNPDEENPESDGSADETPPQGRTGSDGAEAVNGVANLAREVTGQEPSTKVENGSDDLDLRHEDINEAYDYSKHPHRNRRLTKKKQLKKQLWDPTIQYDEGETERAKYLDEQDRQHRYSEQLADKKDGYEEVYRVPTKRQKYTELIRPSTSKIQPKAARAAAAATDESHPDWPTYDKEDVETTDEQEEEEDDIKSQSSRKENWYGFTWFRAVAIVVLLVACACAGGYKVMFAWMGFNKNANRTAEKLDDEEPPL